MPRTNPSPLPPRFIRAAAAAAETFQPAPLRGVEARVTIKMTELFTFDLPEASSVVEYGFIWLTCFQSEALGGGQGGGTGGERC